jgi:hypothetical protein
VELHPLPEKYSELILAQMLSSIQGDVPVAYCPYHHILGVKSPAFRGPPENAGVPYIGSNTNVLRYFQWVNPRWTGPQEAKEVFQPRIVINFPGGERVLPMRDRTSVGSLYNEAIDALKAQQAIPVEQIAQALKAK